MQAARRVDDRDVPSARASRLDGIERDRSGIGSPRSAHEVGARTLGPDLELLLGGCAERVRRADEHGAPVLVELAGQLADGRRLSGAVDADDEDDARARLEGERRWLPEQRLDLLDERALELSGDAARLEPPYELGRRGNSDVASDQRLLEPLPGLVVGRVEPRRRQLGGERLAALRERLAHPAEEARALRLVRLRDVVAEKLGPGTTHAVAARGC